MGLAAVVALPVGILLVVIGGVSLIALQYGEPSLLNPFDRLVPQIERGHLWRKLLAGVLVVVYYFLARGLW
jgi:hypothetical protein